MLKRWRSIHAAGSESNPPLDLFAIQPVIPFHDFIDAGAGFEILEDRRNGHPGSFQNPRAADLSRHTFHEGHCDQSRAGTAVAAVSSSASFLSHASRLRP